MLEVDLITFSIHNPPVVPVSSHGVKQNCRISCAQMNFGNSAFRLLRLIYRQHACTWTYSLPNEHALRATLQGCLWPTALMRADQPSGVMGAAPVFASASYPACVSAYLSSRCCPLVVGAHLQANISAPLVLQLQQTELCCPNLQEQAPATFS